MQHNRYARVSTTDQKLESQIENLKAAGAKKITGTTTEPNFTFDKSLPFDIIKVKKKDLLETSPM